jgi:D-alanyl-D-alanine endopeptidase (penicillin-binding protein 7)
MNLKLLSLATAFLLAPMALSAATQAQPAAKPAAPATSSKPAAKTPSAQPAPQSSATKSAAKAPSSKPSTAQPASRRASPTAAPTKAAAAGQQAGAARAGAATRPAASTRTAPRLASKPTASSRETSSSPRAAIRIKAERRQGARALAKTPAPKAAPAAGESLDLAGPEDGRLRVQSKAALVVDASGNEIYSKNDDLVLPIASITKLMTAVVVLDAGLSLDDTITVSLDDKDFLRNSHSRLAVGSTLSRGDMLRLALMSSENRAAAALARTYPGGTPAFVRAMNAKAQQLGMSNTRFYDSTGLNGSNVSTARDLVKLVQAACEYPLIRDATTTSESEVQPVNRNNLMTYRNSNRLVRGGHWDIGLSKTGYLNEAGRCLVMEARVGGKPLIFVLLNGQGRLTPMGDAVRIRAWLEAGSKTS